MPVYQYECPKCGAKEEVIKSIKDIDLPEVCPVCSKYDMKRIIGNAGGFRLKGGGWAEDGYDQYLGDINKTRKRMGKPELDYNNIHGTDYE